MSDNEDIEIEENEVEDIEEDVYDVEEVEEEEVEEEEEEPITPSAPAIDSCANDAELTAASAAAREYSRYGETIVQCEVVLELGGKKKGVFSKKTVNVERVLVIGKHHIWVLSRSTGKKKPQVLAEFHFFALRSLKHNAESCRLTFALRSNAPKETTLDFQYAKNTAIFNAIVESIMQITYGFPENHLNISSTDGMPEPELPQTTEYEKIVSNYIGQCSFLKAPVNQQLLNYVKNQVESDSHDLDLTTVPIIQKESSDRASGVPILPLLAALEFNTRFRYINVSNCPFPQAMSGIARFVMHNKTLTKLVARNVAASDEGMTRFWDYLRSNADSSLQLIDLSGTLFGQQSIVSCARMLSEWSHPISELILADCGINGKMLQTFFNALNKNPAMSISIQHLDLSGNKFELAGTQAIDSFFATLKIYCQVKKLVLRNTGIVFGALKSFHHVTDIEEIDLSGNKMDSGAVQVLSSLVRNSPTLKSIVLDGCSLSAESLADLCTYMMAQKGPMSFSIANNGDISKGLAKEFAACSERIVEFNFSGARMKEQHFNDLLSQLLSFKGLRKLNLNGAVEKVKSTQGIINSLDVIISNGLEELDLSDSIGKAGILSLLNRVSNEGPLKKIDFSENQLGDDGIAAVCAWLRGARNVKSINLDNNRSSLNGILEMCSVLSVNNVLTEMCIENDFMHELTATSGLARKRLMQAMTRIMLSLNARESEKVFWYTNTETALCLPTPLQQNALPPAPSFFSERKMSVETAPALPGGLNSMQIDSLEVEPVVRERKAPSRPSSHRPIISSRVQTTSSAGPTSPSQAPPTLNAPPSLAVPPTLNAPSSLKAPPMLTVPGQPTSPSAAEPAPRTTPSAGPARRPGAGVAKRSTARRPGAGAAPRANIPRAGGHSSRNFEPTSELQREEEEAVDSPRTPRADEPDPDMPALQPVPVPRSKPQRQAPALPARKLPQPKPEEEEEEGEEEGEPDLQSPHTPVTPTRRMFIGNNRSQRGQP